MNATAEATQKAALRRTFIERRAQTPVGAERDAAEVIAARLHELVAPGSVVGAYAAFDREIAIDAALFRLQPRWTIALPIIERRDRAMRFAIAHAPPTDRGPLGIRQPPRDHVVSIDAIGAFLVPGLAFDPRGVRLGFGGGYYDRYLAQVRSNVLLIGIAFDWQICHALPLEAHDVRMTHVMTPSQTIICASP